MTAIYPIESPGGWHLIGATPLRLFDPEWPEPSLFRPGDMVQFEAIDPDHYEAIRAQVTDSAYAPPYEEIAS